jgi:transcriptional regulator with XRE-family HTH domain
VTLHFLYAYLVPFGNAKQTAQTRYGRMEERVPGEDLYARNREIGRALLKARQSAKKSMRECAEHVGTSRQRYAGFETGKVFIGAVELESLMRYLRMPAHEVWSQDMLEGVRDVVVAATPGEMLRILVNVAIESESG